MAADLAFDARDVSKAYGGRLALDRVSLRIGRGEMVALIGPSGSGKSTLLRALTGLVPIDLGAGRIDVLGQPVQANGRLGDQVRQIRARVGFVFQQFNLVPRLTLFSNVMIGALGRAGFWRGLVGGWSRDDKALGMAALARVGMADAAGQRANSLSGGQQQRGAIARTLVQGAEAVLADEPIASLDPVAARRVMEILRDLNREDGMTVVVSLHQVDYATRYCDRVIALKAGAIAFDGPVRALDSERLIGIYGREFQGLVEEGDRS